MKSCFATGKQQVPLQQPTNVAVKPPIVDHFCIMQMSAVSMTSLRAAILTGYSASIVRVGTIAYVWECLEVC